ncbi:MAG: hypothetical protein HY720_18290 [Planctomycetes bacterium]|nr:hypothetical protein [Planctomycetota bacterium]
MVRGLALLASLFVLGCSYEPEVREGTDVTGAMRVVKEFEEQRVRAQEFPDIRAEDIEVTPVYFDHIVSVQDEGFEVDTVDPYSRLQRIPYRAIDEIKVEWDPIGLIIPFGTLGVLGPHWYTAWIYLGDGRRVFIGRSQTAREVFPMWMNPENYLSQPIEERVEAFEFLRRTARGSLSPARPN